MAIAPEDILPNASPANGNNGVPPGFAQEIIGSPSPAEARGLPPIVANSIDRASTFRGYSIEDLQNGVGQINDKNSLTSPSVGVPTSEVLDQGKRYNEYSPLINNEGIHADNQGTLARLGNAGANLVTKAVGFTLQNAGFVLGAPTAVATKDIGNMTDNFLVKAGDYLNEGVSNAFPIYHSDKYTQGNIWDKLGTSSWWLDDGIDRLALTASMFVPGALEAKGIGLAGLATKALGGLAENPENFSWLGKTFLPKLYKAAVDGVVDAGTNPALRAYAQSLSRAELYSWNVIGQSALNAKETQAAVMKATNDPVKAADAAKNAFWETVPVTLLGSLVELPQMFSTARTAESYLNKLFNPETGELIEGALKPPSIGKTALTAALTGLEHGQNESLQVAISRYNEDKAAGRDTRGVIPGIFGDWWTNFDDPNGQNNIALGTIQGILTTLGGRVSGRITGKTQQEEQYKQSLIDVINQARLSRRFYTGTDVNQRDIQGKIITDEQGKPITDQSKLVDYGLSIAGTEMLLANKKASLEAKDYKAVEATNNASLAAFSYNFFSDPNGMEHLSSLLKIEAQMAKANPDRINDVDEHGNEIIPEIQLQQNLQKAQQFKKVYDAMDQRHAGFFNLDINRNSFKTDEEYNNEVKRGQQFTDHLKWAQYKEATNQSFLSERIGKNNTAINNLRMYEGTEIPNDGSLISSPSNPMEERANDLIKDNEDLKAELQNSKDTYKLLINKPAQRAAFNNEKYNTPEAEQAPPTTVKVKTKEGEKEYQTNTEYVLSKVVDHDEQGHEIYRAPRLSILAQNPDGSLKVKASNGNIKDISADELEDYSLIKPSDIEGNKKAKFYTDNWNTKYQYNFGKGVKKVGRLMWTKKKDTLLFAYKDDDGKLQTREVTGKDFNAQAGYTEPKVKNIGPISAAQALSRDEFISEPSSEQKQIYAKIAKQQTEIEKLSGDAPTPISTPQDPVNLETTPKDDTKKKPLDVLFVSGTKPMNEAEYKPHHYREDKLSNKLADIPDERKPFVKTLLVTKNNNLVPGLIEHLGDVEGTIAYVYVEQTPDGHKFLDKDGNETDASNVDRLVFGTLPTSSLVWKSNNETRYSKGTEAEAKAESEAWEKRRQELLSSTLPEYFNFDFSRGQKQETIIKVDGKNTFQDNAVTETLIQPSDLSTKGLVKVVTTGTIAHQGKTINFRNGAVVLQKGPTLEFLNNRKFNPQEVDSLFKVIKQFAKEAENGNINQQIISYLQGIMFWGKPKKETPSRNQMWFDDGKLFFGDQRNSVALSDEGMTNNEAKVKEFLKSMYNGANARKLESNEPFTEIADVNQDGSLQTVTHKSYQHFLLSPSYVLDKDSLSKPEGTREPHFTTTIRKVNPSINDGLDVNIKYRYPILKGLYDRPVVQQVPAAKTEAKKAEAASTSNTIQKAAETYTKEWLNDNPRYYYPGLENIDENETDEYIQHATPVRITPENLQDALSQDKKLGEAIVEKSGKGYIISDVIDPLNGYIQVPIDSSTSIDTKGFANIEEAHNQETDPEVKAALKRFMEKYGVTSTSSKATIEGVYPFTSTKGSQLIDSNTWKSKSGTLIKFTTDEEGINFDEDDTFKATVDKLSQTESSKQIAERLKISVEQAAELQLYKLIEADIKEQKETELTKAAEAVNTPAEVKPVEAPPAPDVKTQDENSEEEIIRQAREAAMKAIENMGKGIGPSSNSGYRVVGNSPIIIGDINAEKKWFEQRFGIPFHTVDNLIKTTDGGWAWGQFKDAAVYIYKNAEIGTSYHEAFETVWNMYTSLKQRQNIHDEFQSRLGTFIDRESGNTIKYSDATDTQAKEQLAEEFRDYIMTGKMVKPVAKKNFIQKLFESLKNFINKFILGKDDITSVFKKIDKGYYKNAKPVYSQFQQGFRAIKIGNLDASTQYKVIQGVTAEAIRAIFKSPGISLISFDDGRIKTSDIYQKVYRNLENKYTIDIPAQLADSLKQQKLPLDLLPEILQPYMALWNNIKTDFQNVEKLTDEYLRTMGIVKKTKIVNKPSLLQAYEDVQDEYEKEAEENTISVENTSEDKAIKEDEFISSDLESKDGSRSDSYVEDYMKVDWKKSSSPAIKLLISTLTENAFAAAKKYLPGEVPGIVETFDGETGLTKAVKSATTFNAVMKSVLDANTIEEKAAKLLELGQKYPNYIQLYQKLRLDKPYNERTDDDWTLLSRFFNVFSKQNPEGIILTNDGSKVYTSSANLQSQKDDTIKVWLSNLKDSSAIKLINNTYVFGDDAKKIPIDTPEQKTKFLESMGIKFPISLYEKLNADDKRKYNEAVSGLQSTFIKNSEIAKKGGLILATDGKSLQVSSRYNTLAHLHTKAAKEEWESIYYNIEGDPIQQFIQNDAISNMMNDFNNSKTRQELINELPHLSHPYSEDSIYLNEELFDEEGKRNDKPLNMKFIMGTRDTSKSNPNIPTKQLTESQRMLQEVNMNLNGDYYILVPGDSSTEKMINMGNPISIAQWQTNKGGQWAKADRIFEQYEKTEQEFGDGKNRIVSELTNKYTKPVKEALREFVKDTVDSDVQYLKDYSYIDANGKVKGLLSDFIDEHYKHGFSEKELRDLLEWRTLNYMINNVELTKLFFGDIANFKDFTKRVKSYNSPRQNSIYGSDDFTNHLNDKKNLVGNIQLQPGDVGYHPFDDHFNTIVLDDVISSNEALGKLHKEYKDTKSTDAQSYATLPGYREIRMRNGDWYSRDETQYQYQMSMDRLAMEEDGKYKYTDPLLNQMDRMVKEKGNPNASFFPVYKPIYSGFSVAENPADIKSVLDKTSTAPLWYTQLRGKPLSNHLVNMYNANITYAIFPSGRKVGSQEARGFDDYSPITNDQITKLNYRFYGKQVETNSNKKRSTRGSQMSKLAFVNLLEHGVPQDFKGTFDEWYNMDDKQRRASSSTYDAIQHNIDVLREMTDRGYDNLLKKLGFIDNQDGYIGLDKDKLLSLLKDELFRRELPSSIKDALSINPETNDFMVPLESLPNYSTIKSIIYSYIDSNIVRPKLNGGDKVQISGAGWGELKFYEPSYDKDNKLVSVGKCEVLLPNWFADKLRARGFNKSNEELMKYLNSTEEGKKILSGIGFRIPTQELNSIESFIVKGFLDEHSGSSIVVPQEIVTKAGSDFDVDKLNTYLKNVYIDKKGNPRLVPFKGMGEAGLKEMEKLAYTFTDFTNVKEAAALLNDDTILDELPEDEEFNRTVQDLYDQSLENEYFSSLEGLVLHPDNFDRLIKPNSSEDLTSLSEDLEEISPEEFGDAGLKSIINPRYMSKLRHYFIAGKGGIGIAATAQTGHAIRQLTPTIIDKAKYNAVGEKQQKFLDKNNGDILLPHNTITFKGKTFPSLSGVKDKASKFITDTILQIQNGFVDISNNPFIIKINCTKQLTPAWTLLTELGVPSRITGYFMNQPIIRDFLKEVKQSEYPNFMFNDDMIKAVKEKYVGTKPALETRIDKLSGQLKDFIVKRYKENAKFTEAENATQKLLLDEFLKYQVMASQMFEFTQASTWDTSSYPDSNLIHKKEKMYEKVKSSNIIHSIVNILIKTHIGDMKKAILSARDVIGEHILPLESGAVRETLNSVLDRFQNKPQAIYQKAATKIEQSLFNYLLQIKVGLNTRIKQLFTDEKTNLVSTYKNLMNSLPEGSDIKNNLILQNLKPLIRERNTQTKNFKLTVPKDALSQDMFTQAFEDLKNNSHTAEFYSSLVKMALLQNGLTGSNLSFTKFIPLEDFSAAMNKLIPHFDDVATLNNYERTDGFWRNSWKDSSLVPRVKEDVKEVETEQGDTYLKNKKSYSKPWLDELVKSKGLNPAIYKPIKVSTLARAGDSPFVTMRRNVQQFEDLASGEYYLPKEARQDKDFFSKSLLLKRVEDTDGNPLKVTEPTGFGHTHDYYIYLPVNAWGDGQYLQEFYESAEPSAVDNNTFKFTNESGFGVEISNEEFLSAYNNSQAKPTQVEATETAKASPINIYAGANENPHLSNFAARPFNIGAEKYNSVEQAFQAAKMSYAPATAANKAILDKIMSSKSAAEAKKLGRQYVGLEADKWNNDSAGIMKQLIKSSFEQNPETLKQLVATGNVELTHVQDTGKWKTEFPRILMEVRDELKNTQTTNDKLNFKPGPC